MKSKLLGVFGLCLFVPDAAWACPVCFGAIEGPMADGVNMAILALLGFTLVVLGGFAAFFVYLMRRARLARESEWAHEVIESA
jgi:hypothetical protein